ncbi:2-hydroxyacid dehydrogenase [Phytohabitans aurantiacus]|uniref:D-glycerate dehydrogenase n=1 Tax=Phytohabitans aurantiacus TaxID=3016789 RepID=A0ABQ5RAW3_9ACTN|nr:D-glycerate dehydrogenase [Phytohabitans aurantiacus]GLI03869.1 D-glycerate dehydrogenase [Phytohabitans aurantiacus]
MTSVLVTRRLPTDVAALLRHLTGIDIDVETWPGAGLMPREKLLRKVAGRAAVITMLTDRVDAELLETAGPDLRIVANYAVGHDNIDLSACQQHAVVATNTPDVLTAATADATWALILAAGRRIVEGDAVQRAGTPWSWAPDFLLGREITGKTLGIVGFGRIGQAVARRAAGFEMTVLFHTASSNRARTVPGATATPLAELLARSDIITVHLPATAATHHFFGRQEFAAMKPGTLFVNTARGNIVDEGALSEALASGHLFAAGLDVFEHEPHVHRRLRELPNTVLTPHIASATSETRAAMAELACRNIAAVLNGQDPLTPIQS